MTPVRDLAGWLSYLEQLHPSAIDMGLERSRQVALQLGLGRPAPRVITVTGTNGKGSTCALLAAQLKALGLRVGVYSSPHLLRYNERVQVDGCEVSDEQLCHAFEAVEKARGEISLTYFEMGTLAAFWLFEQAGLDAVVLEVGLGGRLDAVNLVDADLALITSIGLDHAEWLGDTRESVAFEKAGICRAGRPVLCGDLDPPQTLLDEVARLDCPLFLRGRDFDLHLQESGWDWQGLTADGLPIRLQNLPLLDLPMENAALALQALALLGLDWDEARIARALLDARVVGRLDRRTIVPQGQPLELLLDVGHNPHAAQYLAERLERGAQPVRRLAVFGLLADKDLDGVLMPLLSQVDHWLVTTLDSPRSRPASELQDALQARGASVENAGTVEAALERVARQAGSGTQVLVFGSFYCVAEALQWLQANQH